MSGNEVVKKLSELVDLVEHHPRERGVLSTGERIAVAIVLRRIDWLREDGFSDLDAASDLLGAEWLHACKVVVKERNAARIKLVEESKSGSAIMRFVLA